jgi:hypothetical protein
MAVGPARVHWAIAGAFAGAAGAAALRVLRNDGAPRRAELQFSALLGSILGLFSGLGGGVAGGTLAESVLVCPNGYFANPFTPSGCAAGILPGAPLFGMWTGAVAGAIVAILTVFALSRLKRTPPASTGES